MTSSWELYKNTSNWIYLAHQSSCFPEAEIVTITTKSLCQMNPKIDLTFDIKHLRAHVIKANKNSSITESVHCGVFECDINCLHFFCLVSIHSWARNPNNLEVMPKKTLSNTWLFCVLNVFQIKLLWSMHKSKTRYPGAMAMEHTKRLPHKQDNLSTHYSFLFPSTQKRIF